MSDTVYTRDAVETATDPAPEPAARPTSMLVNGAFPRSRVPIVVLAATVGFLLTVAWSASFADDTIGLNVAGDVLGHNAEAPIASSVAGIVFALVSGLAGSFTACNVAALGAVAPLLGSRSGRQERLRAALTPLGWLALGSIVLAGVYGFLVGLLGTRMPQFSSAKPMPGHLAPWAVQAMVTFGVLGLTMVWFGLAALGYVPDPFARISRRFTYAPMFVLGAMIGAFQIGRPYPLFRELFRHAANTGNPAYGAAAFILQALGNIAVMSVVFLLLTVLLTGRAQRWLTAKPSRVAAITAASMVTAGVFLIMYWDVRLLDGLKVISWYPLAPWA